MQKTLTKLFNLFDSESAQTRLFYWAVAAVFVLLFALNYAVPTLLDDLVYSLVKFEETVQFPQILVQIKDFQIAHYFNWGGRTVAHTIANILLALPPIGQDLLNTSAFMFFLILIYRMANAGNRNNLFVFLFAFLMVFIFVPRFASDTLWIIGSSNYLWTTMLIFSAIYFYYQYSIGKEYRDSIGRMLGVGILGLLAGWTNENMGPTLVLILAIYCIYFRLKKIGVPKWSVSGLTGAIAGAGLLILSPGNKKRSAVEGIDNLNLFDTLSANLLHFSNTLIYYREFLLPLVAIFVVGLVLFYFYHNSSCKKNAILFNAFGFMLAGDVAFFATLLAPSFPLRAYFGLIAFKIFAIIILYANISFEKLYLKILNLACLALMMSFVLVESYKIYNAFSFVGEVNEARVDQIREAKRAGLDTVEIYKPVFIDYKYEYVEAELFWEIYYKMERISFSGKEYERKNDR